jgi:hypothetical protein
MRLHEIWKRKIKENENMNVNVEMSKYGICGGVSKV